MSPQEATASVSNTVFPMPASPVNSRLPPRPSRSWSKTALTRPISASRPTITDRA